MTGDLIAAGGYVTTIIAFFVGKRKSKADAQNSELDAAGKAVTIWRQLAEEFKNQVEELRKEIKKLSEENAKIHNEFQKFKKQINS